ncbi:hypothetical protein GW916_06750 [bacterium]|nr:hypothetical protein [bacterium]
MKNLSRILTLSLICFASSSWAQAQVSRYLAFQGQIPDLTNGDYDVELVLNKGGFPVETFPVAGVTFTGGVFQINLASDGSPGFSPSDFSSTGQDLTWDLKIDVDGLGGTYEEVFSGIQLSSVPSAFLAQRAIASDNSTEAANALAIGGNAVQSATLGSGEDNYVLTWNNGENRWEAQSASSGGPANTDALPEGSTNLYFTDTRAQTATIQSGSITNGGTLAPTHAAVFNALATKANSADLANKLDNALPNGNIFVGNGGTATPLPPGSDGKVLTITGGVPTWENSTSAVTQVNGQTGTVVLTTDQITEGGTNKYLTEVALLDYLKNTTSNVGIGVTGPTEKLDVNGNIKANNTELSGNLSAGDFVYAQNYLKTGSGGNIVQLMAPTTGGLTSITFPAGSGSDGDLLSTDGAGNLSWTNIPTAYSDVQALAASVQPGTINPGEATKAPTHSEVHNALMNKQDSLNSTSDIGLNNLSIYNSILLKDDDGSDWITFQAPATASSYALTLPVNSPGPDTILKSDAVGNLTWEPAPIPNTAIDVPDVPGLKISIGHSARGVSSGDISIGEGSGAVSGSGFNNISVGKNAGTGLNDGSGNLVLGTDSAANLTTGSDNTIIGPQSGQTLESGNNNILIGKNSKTSFNNSNFSVAIGNTAKADHFGIALGKHAYAEASTFAVRLNGDPTDDASKNQMQLDQQGHLKVNTIQAGQKILSVDAGITVSPEFGTVIVTHTLTSAVTHTLPDASLYPGLELTFVNLTSYNITLNPISGQLVDGKVPGTGINVDTPGNGGKPTVKIMAIPAAGSNPAQWVLLSKHSG